MIKKSRRPTRFALCVDSGEYPASLERRKLYEVIPDEDARQHGQLRIIDDSGEDYLYPREYFQLVELSPSLSRLMQSRGKRSTKTALVSRRTARMRSAR